VKEMLTEYIEMALARARVEKMEDGRFFACIPDFKGVWADGDSSEASLKELRGVLEEWLVIALREDDTLPELSGVSLNFGGKRWRRPLAAES
jgi:predicted RNase H-like HicB family nuclease